MAQWRDIPTLFNWDGSSVKVHAPKPNIVPPRKPAAVSAVVSSASPSILNDFEARVQLATLKTELALNNVLDLIEAKIVASAPVAAPVPPSVDAVISPPAEVTMPASPEPAQVQIDPWGNAPQRLNFSGAPIYPDGRPIKNPNHLLVFVRNGAEIHRMYSASGWVSKLHRADGRENPLANDVVEMLISAGQIDEKRPGVYRGF